MFIYKTNKYNKAKYSLGNPTDLQGHLYYGPIIKATSARKQTGHKWIYKSDQATDLQELNEAKVTKTVTRTLYPLQFFTRMVMQAARVLLPLFRLGKILIKKNKKSGKD